jgi:hypothetical protein
VEAESVVGGVEGGEGWVMRGREEERVLYLCSCLCRSKVWCPARYAED